MSIESICREEALALMKRGPKYWPLVISMYMKGIREGITAQTFRASYFFCRHVDDVLDGDRAGITDKPDVYVRHILDAMDGEATGPRIVEVYRFAISELVEIAQEGEDPKSLFERVVRDAMLFDYERAQQRKVLTREELEKYYEDTFAPVMDLALMIAGSDLRSVDMPESIAAQGHLYSIRDLDDDLAQGIINIPKEELDKSKIDTSKPFTAQDVINDPHLRAWINREVAQYAEALDQWSDKLTDKPSKKVCSLLIQQLRLFCKVRRWRNSVEIINIPVAVIEALRLSFKYRASLGVSWRKLKAMLVKSANLALCYQGFGHEVSVKEARGAGKAAFASCAYDVVTDWHKSPKGWSDVFRDILEREVGGALTEDAMALHGKDTDENLEDDGLERGSVAFRFVLELMGLTESFGQKSDIDDLGALLQIVDDVLDLEEDLENGDTNCLTSPRRNDYLKRVITDLSEEQVSFLFPNSKVLAKVIGKARENAVELLQVS